MICKFSAVFMLLSGLIAVIMSVDPQMALAAGEGSYHLDGASISAWWALPFAGMLLSIAFGPIAVPHFWEHHFGKVTIFWIAVFLIPAWVVFGYQMTLYAILEVLVLEYFPFVILLFSLFTITGGICFTGQLVGTPRFNVMLLIFGSILASWIGTVGASMLLIRPLLRANAHRRYKVHSVVFFIFLVANIGGSLTPLGDPPLFLGFLKGVSFFWTTTHLFWHTFFLVSILLVYYFILDSLLYKLEARPEPATEGPQQALGFQDKILSSVYSGLKRIMPVCEVQPQSNMDGSEQALGILGKKNFIFLLGVVGMVLLSGLWHTPITINIWADIERGLPGLVRDVVLLLLAAMSWYVGREDACQRSNFNWEPIKEVAKLFIGIFLTLAPVISILRAGTQGALGGLVSLVTGSDGQPVNSMYFWLTGIFSSFLDNAPTYVVFFNMAGGEAQILMNIIPGTLAAISAGAVFMGAVTYIGNAPNFMVRSIAIEQGVPMPSFFGYIGWSMILLMPLFAVLTVIFF